MVKYMEYKEMLELHRLEERVVQEYTEILNRSQCLRTVKCADLVFRERCYQTKWQGAPADAGICSYLEDFLGENGTSFEDMMEKVREEAEAVLLILDDFKREVKKIVEQYQGYLWHVTSKKELRYIKASRHQRNMYGNAWLDAVFATSDEIHRLLYAGRAVAGAMKVDNCCNCRYETNPFLAEKGYIGVLKSTVYSYQLDVRYFEPVIDFVMRDDEKGEIRYGREWVSEEKQVPVMNCCEIREIDMRKLGKYRIRLETF